MEGLCEGGNEPPGSLNASLNLTSETSKVTSETSKITKPGDDERRKLGNSKDWQSLHVVAGGHLPMLSQEPGTNLKNRNCCTGDNNLNGHDDDNDDDDDGDGGGGGGGDGDDDDDKFG
ncbi:hypothetical protein ANN_23876 [Periplaneta americana]|uniref:Uncharacterized protein n=1 Tax=Periplaneta americana TaxID=6978 RepID=A0ABQ8S1I8_PERAM|nr:hypothetical protein ANN_23876 [Periplaneta americana]